MVSDWTSQDSQAKEASKLHGRSFSPWQGSAAPACD